MCFSTITADQMGNLKFENKSKICLPEKCGANMIVKVHYKFTTFWWVADIELNAFNEG